MKLLGLLFVFISFSAAQASFNEFECEFETEEGKEVTIEVEKPFGGSSSRSARMTVTSENQVDVHNFFVTARFPRYSDRIEYFGGNFNLTIDLWPDRAPRWGRTYRSDFHSWILDEGRFYHNIDCRYTRF